MSDFGKPSPSTRHLHFKGVLARESIDTFLYRNMPDFKPELVQWLIGFGAVYINGHRVLQSDEVVGEEDLVRIHLDPKRYPVDRKDLRKKIIFENEHFLVINKPQGLPMHPTLDNLRENLVSALGENHFVTHRLDVPTSGLVVVAKTKLYQSAFNRLVSSRQLQKTYLALVNRQMEPGVMRHFMKVSVKVPKEICETPSAGEIEKRMWDECLLRVVACQYLKSEALHELEIHLLTGRTHQIRTQLSYTGNPIVGDEMYGGPSHRLFGLHASRLAFLCPISNESYDFESSPPWHKH